MSDLGDTRIKYLFHGRVSDLCDTRIQGPLNEGSTHLGKSESAGLLAFLLAFWIPNTSMSTMRSSRAKKKAKSLQVFLMSNVSAVQRWQ